MSVVKTGIDVDGGQSVPHLSLSDHSPGHVFDCLPDAARKMASLAGALLYKVMLTTPFSRLCALRNWPLHRLDTERVKRSTDWARLLPTKIVRHTNKHRLLLFVGISFRSRVAQWKSAHSLPPLPDGHWPPRKCSFLLDHICIHSFSHSITAHIAVFKSIFF